MNPENVFLQTALIFRTMWTVRATLGRIFAALDPQVIPHVSQPAIILATLRTLEATWISVDVFRSSKRSFFRAQTIRDFLLIGHLVLVT